MKARFFNSILVVLLAVGMTLPGLTQFDNAQAAPDEIYEISEVIAATENYEYVRSLMMMMNENRPLDEVAKVVYEVERYVMIADELLEVGKIFYEGQQKDEEMKQLRRIVAKTHLLCCAFYVYQKNFSGAQEEFRLAEEIYPEMYDDVDLEIETKGERDKKLHNLVRFQMMDIQKFKSWFEGTVGTSFQFEVEVSEAFVPENILGVQVKSLNVLAPESNSYRLIELANKEIENNLAEGKRYFRITLAPGDYQLTQEEGTIYPQKFSIMETQDPFTVFIQPDEWFSLQYAENYRKSMPRLYYYGIEMTEDMFDRMPYGPYDVKVDPKYFDFEFAQILFSPLAGEGEENEIAGSANYVEIKVPLQGKYPLDLGKKGVFARLGDRTVD